MYYIEYYTRKGCLVMQGIRFETVGQAERFARKNRAYIGKHYLVLPFKK